MRNETTTGMGGGFVCFSQGARKAPTSRLPGPSHPAGSVRVCESNGSESERVNV